MQTRRYLALAVLILLGLAFSAASPSRAEPIQGAGSTFAAPIIARWAQVYRTARTDGGDFTSGDWNVDYEPVGSTAGMMRLMQPETDFAASDAPLPAAELRRRGLVQFPIVLGGIAPVVNLDGVAPGKLRLTGGLIADIYLGKVRTWADPALKALNPDVALPDLPIAVVHRRDGSGSTLNWTEFLSAHSDEWKSKVGSDTIVKWPVGSGAEGSSGVIRKVRETKGAIGYVEFGQVARAGLSDAAVGNRAGAFVRPTLAAIQAAAAAADWDGAPDFALSLTDAKGQDAYPITVVTFAQIHAIGRSAARTRRTLGFFKMALERGGADAEALGYAPLPDALVGQVTAYWARSYRNLGSF